MVVRIVLYLLAAAVVAGVVARLPGRGGALGVQELRNLHDGGPDETGRPALDLRRPRDLAVVVFLGAAVAAIVVVLAVS